VEQKLISYWYVHPYLSTKLQKADNRLFEYTNSISQWIWIAKEELENPFQSNGVGEKGSVFSVNVYKKKNASMKMPKTHGMWKNVVRSRCFTPTLE
jgi:hypothetical protein